jgi:hypothetical protein
MAAGSTQGHNGRRLARRSPQVGPLHGLRLSLLDHPGGDGPEQRQRAGDVTLTVGGGSDGGGPLAPNVPPGGTTLNSQPRALDQRAPRRTCGRLFERYTSSSSSRLAFRADEWKCSMLIVDQPAPASANCCDRALELLDGGWLARSL